MEDIKQHKIESETESGSKRDLCWLDNQEIYSLHVKNDNLGSDQVQHRAVQS